MDSAFSTTHPYPKYATKIPDVLRALYRRNWLRDSIRRVRQCYNVTSDLQQRNPRLSGNHGNINQKVKNFTCSWRRPDIQRHL